MEDETDRRLINGTNINQQCIVKTSIPQDLNNNRYIREISFNSMEKTVNLYCYPLDWNHWKIIQTVNRGHH